MSVEENDHVNETEEGFSKSKKRQDITPKMQIAKDFQVMRP